MEQQILSEDSLYAWQREAIETWQGNGRIGVVQAVTGAGKTRVGLTALREAWRRGKRAVIVVPTLDLVAQWAMSIRGVIDGFYVATTTASHRDDWRVLLIGTVHTLAKTYPCREEEAPLLIADECHRYGAAEFAHVLDDRYDWRLGLTATYARDDEGDDLLQAFFRDIVFDLWYDRALAEDVIAPFRIALVSVPMSPEERSSYDEFSEAMWHSRKRLEEQHRVPTQPVSAFLQAVVTMARIETHPGMRTARQYMSAFSKRRTLLAGTRANYQALAVMHEIVSRSTGALVFTQSQKSAEMAVQTIAATGHDATAVFSGLDKDERALRMDAFRNREVSMLAAPRILDEGIDVPEADLGIIVAANRSRRQMVQRLGRVLRKKHDRRAARFVVLYAAGTVEDPTMLEDPSGFYVDCLPHAQAHRRFEIATEVDALLDFLWAPEPAAPPVTAERSGPAEAPSTFRYDELDDSDDPKRSVFNVGATQSAFKDYLAWIGQSPLLTAEEEIQLARLIEAGVLADAELHQIGRRRYRPEELITLVRDGRAAKEQFVRANLRLVVHIAKDYAGRGLDSLDLVQEGSLGLIRAVEKFDYRRGGKFSTYAVWWIRQSITRALADSSRTIRYPVHLVEQVTKIRSAERAFAAVKGRLPTVNELSAHAEIEPAKIDELLSLPVASVPVDGLLELEHDGFALARLCHTFEDEVIDAIRNRQAALALLGCLSDKERFILSCRAGYPSGEPMTLDEIGRILGVTRERVRQIEATAKKRLSNERPTMSTKATQASTSPGQRLKPPRTGPARASGVIHATVGSGAPDGSAVSAEEAAQIRARAAEILNEWPEEDSEKSTSTHAAQPDPPDAPRPSAPHSPSSATTPSRATAVRYADVVVAAAAAAARIWAQLPASVADRIGFSTRSAQVGELIASHLDDVPLAERAAVISAVRSRAYTERPHRDARFATVARALLKAEDIRLASRKLGISAQTIRILVASHPHDVSLTGDYLADIAGALSNPLPAEATRPVPTFAEPSNSARRPHLTDGGRTSTSVSQHQSQAPQTTVKLRFEESRSIITGGSDQSMSSDAGEIAFQVQASLLRAGAVVHLPDAESFPHVVALHPDAGLIVMDISTEIDGAMAALNRKFATLRESLSTLERVPTVRRIVSTMVSESTAQVLSVEDATGTGWLDALPAKRVPDGLNISLQTYFGPRVELDVPVRDSLADAGAGERAMRRIQLDAVQSEAARMEVEDVLAITGPPGSGKSLVLAARACWLSDEHPDWRIAVLCFNNALVPYLRTLVGDRPNVTINTLGKFAYSYGVRVDFNDPDLSEKYVGAKLPRLVTDLDAILIDEWQDFDPAWTRLALALLRRRRGGLTVAGDPRQALRRDGDASPVFAGRVVKHMELMTPYRSTRQVLEVTAALDEDFRVNGASQAPDGEPVDLVWAHSWPEQANAAAHDVQLVLKDGVRRPQDVGILVTRKRMIGRLVHALGDLGVPARAVHSNQAGELDLSTPDVKVMTVHSAKGLEFDVAVLIGLEELPPPSRNEEAVRQGRTGYVGTTRARDQLIITYTKNSTYLDRIRALPETTLRPWVWPDDYPEV